LESGIVVVVVMIVVRGVDVGVAPGVVGVVEDDEVDDPPGVTVEVGGIIEVNTMLVRTTLFG